MAPVNITVPMNPITALNRINGPGALKSIVIDVIIVKTPRNV